MPAESPPASTGKWTGWPRWAGTGTGGFGCGGHPAAAPEAGTIRYRARWPDGQDGHPPALVKPAELRARNPVKYVLDRRCVPVENEWRVVVVHRERPARREVSPGRRERLGGEQVALETDSGLAGQRRQRVGQRIHDQVVVLLCVLQVLTAVGHMDGDPRALVRVGRGRVPAD